MTSVSYKPNRAGFRKLMTDPMLSKGCVRQAEKGMKRAENISPVKTGHYKASFRVRPAMVQVGNEMRAGAILENTAWYAVFVEAHLRILHRVVDTVERG